MNHPFAPNGAAAHTASPRRQQRRLDGALRRRVTTDIIFIAPAAILFTAVVMYPILSGLFYGFTDWDGINPHIAFIGLANFVKLAHDTIIREAVRNTLLFAVATTGVQTLLGLVLALALHGRAWIYGPLRVLFLMPIILGGLAIALVFTFIYDPQIGIFNAALIASGHASWVQDWLGNPHLAMGSIIAANAWEYTGFTMIIFLAGLQGVPLDLYEAANIDGAGAWQRFSHITWPLIAPATTINVLLTLIGSLKVFDIILVMTNGGPGYTTTSVVVYLYGLAFNNSTNSYDSYGYPAAISVALSVAIFAISLTALYYLRRREVAL